MLTQAQVKELFDYDPQTGNLIWRSDRGTKKVKGKHAGTLSHGYIRIRVRNKFYAAHRLIWLWHYGVMPQDQIDHINGSRADNRIENLREATGFQNQQNSRKPRSNNSSGYLGISPHKGRWRAQILVNRVKYHIGIYDSPEKAHEAYLAKKRELHPFGTL